MKKMNRSVRSLCLAAMIAALYLALTLLFQPISFGAVQFRISEAMTLLPAIFPEATIGLTLGCFLSNFLAGANVYDVVFGTLATLLAALISWRVGKKKALVRRHSPGGLQRRYRRSGADLCLSDSRPVDEHAHRGRRRSGGLLCAGRSAGPVLEQAQG